MDSSCPYKRAHMDGLCVYCERDYYRELLNRLIDRFKFETNSIGGFVKHFENEMRKIEKYD